MESNVETTAPIAMKMIPFNPNKNRMGLSMLVLWLAGAGGGMVLGQAPGMDDLARLVPGKTRTYQTEPHAPLPEMPPAALRSNNACRTSAQNGTG